MKWVPVIHCHPDFESPALRHLLANRDEIIERSTQILKEDPTSTVVVVPLDTRLVVIKRANTKNRSHWLRRLFTHSRARRNWNNVEKCVKAGIKTFQPIAFLEERKGILKGRSYFVYEYIQGIEAARFFEKGALWQDRWETVVARIVHLFDRLATHAIAHRDLNLRNILIIDDEPWLIDLDGMRRPFYHRTDHEQRRFIRNCKEDPLISPQAILLFESFLGKTL